MSESQVAITRLQVKLDKVIVSLSSYRLNQDPAGVLSNAGRLLLQVQDLLIESCVGSNHTFVVNGVDVTFNDFGFWCFFPFENNTTKYVEIAPSGNFEGSRNFTVQPGYDDERVENLTREVKAALLQPPLGYRFAVLYEMVDLFHTILSRLQQEVRTNKKGELNQLCEPDSMVVSNMKFFHSLLAISPPVGLWETFYHMWQTQIVTADMDIESLWNAALVAVS